MDSTVQMEALATEAKVCIETGGHPDNLVLQAIGLGAGTRREIKAGLRHFGYDVIEKALERQSAEIRSNFQGSIERFELVGARSNGHAPKATPFNPFTPTKGSNITKPEFESALKKASAPVSVSDKCGCGRERWHKGRCAARRAAAAERRESELTCESCGKPRSPGSGRRCRACYEGRADVAPVEAVSPGTRKAVPQRGVTYKELDLAEVEEVMAAASTMAEGAKKLGLTVNQLSTRRNKDQTVEDAVQRGRDRCYENMPEVDIDAKEGEVLPVSYIKENLKESVGARAITDAPAIDDRAPALSKPEIREKIAGILYIQDVNSPVLTDALIEAETAITAHVLAKQKPYGSSEDLLAGFNNLPSAVLKEIREDDAYFMNAYETLIGILDNDMDGDEKSAVWTLILYLKSLERTRYAQKD